MGPHMALPVMSGRPLHYSPSRVCLAAPWQERLASSLQSHSCGCILPAQHSGFKGASELPRGPLRELAKDG